VRLLVLGKVRAVGKSFAAYFTAMNLLLVMDGSNVRCQSRFDCKSFPTVLARVLSRLRMRGLVVSQLLFCDKASVTAGMCTGKRLVASMTVHVPHQLRLVAEVHLSSCFHSTVVLRAILPKTAICAVLAGVVGLDMIVKRFSRFETQEAWLPVHEPAAAEVAIEGCRCPSQSTRRMMVMRDSSHSRWCTVVA